MRITFIAFICLLCISLAGQEKKMRIIHGKVTDKKTDGV